MNLMIKKERGTGEDRKELVIPWYDLLILGSAGALITGIVMYFVSGKKD